MIVAVCGRSDCWAISDIPNAHHYVPRGDVAAGVALTTLAGCDMACGGEGLLGLGLALAYGAKGHAGRGGQGPCDLAHHKPMCPCTWATAHRQRVWCWCVCALSFTSGGAISGKQMITSQTAFLRTRHGCGASHACVLAQARRRTLARRCPAGC